ncbi:MAG TPA: YHS domain-containing (seleno)protein [Burkholderiales bacterium]|nr:YHS domain-containing (seleno)protein [Burkholderiales bacterium]
MIRFLAYGLPWLGSVVVAAAALSACSGSVNVVSEGGDANLMLGGRDPVAYFSAGKAVLGRADIKTGHRDLTYRFASDENRRQFISSPERYVPQFGAFCAQHMAYAVPVPASADVFKIIDGKLYLFADARAKLYFEMDQARNLDLAWRYWDSEVQDANWHFQSFKRQIFRAPDYKSDAELADEYRKRFGKKPGV